MKYIGEIMTNRFMIISLVFFVSKAGFAGNILTSQKDKQNYHSTDENANELIPEDWQKEAFEAAENNREPSYLESLRVKFEESLNLKNITEEGEKNLNIHAYSLLFTMSAFHTAAINSTKIATNAAYKELTRTTEIPKLYRHLAFDQTAELKTVNPAVWENAMDTASKATEIATLKAHKNATLIDTEIATLKQIVDKNDFFESTLNGAKIAAIKVGDEYWGDKKYWSDAKDAAKTAVMSAIKQSKGKDKITMRVFAYRVAETTILLHILENLENFEQFIAESYNASVNELSDIDNKDTIFNDSIFESEVKWKKFKTTYLDKIMRDPKAYHFLKSWIEKLDEIVNDFEIKSDSNL